MSTRGQHLPIGVMNLLMRKEEAKLQRWAAGESPLHHCCSSTPLSLSLLSCSVPGLRVLPLIKLRMLLQLLGGLLLPSGGRGMKKRVFLSLVLLTPSPYKVIRWFPGNLLTLKAICDLCKQGKTTQGLSG